MTDMQQQEPINLDVHVSKSLEQYKKAKPLYERFAAVVKHILSSALDSADGIKIASIHSRAKTEESFARKVSIESEQCPGTPKYLHPLRDITDLSGIRVITFNPNALDAVGQIIGQEFHVEDKINKTEMLIEKERFGYAGIHYIVRLSDERTSLAEYTSYKGLYAEVQVRTIIQHAWAEIEHGIQYKSAEVIPKNIRRRIMVLAGMFELADREFQDIQDEDSRITQDARSNLDRGELENIEITPDALRAYLDKKLWPDGRMTELSYQISAEVLRELGFVNFKQVDECIRNYNSDDLSQIVWGSRQGQIRRFELMLLTGMGEHYVNRHPWRIYDWHNNQCQDALRQLMDNGINIGAYMPSET